MLETFGELLIFLLDILFWVIVIQAVVSWLVAFNVINTTNQQAGNLVRLLERITDPLYAPLRRFIPPIGGIDITPIIVIFAIMLLQRLIAIIFFGA